MREAAMTHGEVYDKLRRIYVSRVLHH